MGKINIYYKDALLDTVLSGEEKALNVKNKYCEDNITLKPMGLSIPDDACYTLETFNSNNECITVTVGGKRPIIDYGFAAIMTLETATLNDGILSIGSNAFYADTSLSNITIPNTVTSIGDSAFYACVSLTEVTLPSELTYLGNYAFSLCRSIEKFSVGNNITYLGDYCIGLSNEYAFYNNEENWENNILYFGNYAVSAKDLGLTNLIFRDGTIWITVQPLYIPRATVTSVTIPNSVIRLSDGFYWCSELSNVYFKGTPSQWAAINFLNEYCSPGSNSQTYNLYCNNVLVKDIEVTNDVNPYAFSYCTTLEKVTINKPGEVSLGTDAFFRANVKELVFTDNVTAVTDLSLTGMYDLDTVRIGDNVCSVHTSATSIGSSLSNVYIGKSLKEISAGAFASYHQVEGLEEENFNRNNLYYNGTLETWCNIKYLTSDDEYLEESAFQLGIMYIYQLYINNQKIEDVVIPDSITTLDRSFAGAIGLKTVDLNNVVSVFPFSFLYCLQINSINIGKNLGLIEYENKQYGIQLAFPLCPLLSNISVDSDNKTYYAEDNILFSKNKDTLYLYPCQKKEDNYTIPDGVTTLAEGSFSYASNLKTLIISDDVTSMHDAISIHGSLESITIGKNVNDLENREFTNCDDLQTIAVDINNPYYSAENGILYNKDKTSILQYPDGHLGASYIVPSTINALEDYTLNGAKNLTTVTFASTPDTIGRYALSSNVQTINVPWAEGTVTNAPWGASNATINYNYTEG